MRDNAVYVGIWQRFSQYEIKDARIMPANGAVLETYDPWQLYADAVKNRTDPPYQEFVRLIEASSGRPGPDGRFVLDGQSEERLLNWCSKFGLLGILPHEVLFTSLAPRWEEAGRVRALEGRAFAPEVLAHARSNFGWQTSAWEYDQDEVGHRLVTDSEELEHQLVEREAWGLAPHPHVIRQDLWTGLIEKQDLETYMPDFFPSVPKDEQATFVYPITSSDRFWNLYAEPVSAFLAAGEVLKEATAEQSRPADIEDETGGLSLFNTSLLAPVSPAFRRHKGSRPEMGWLCKSLISSLAMMAVLDLVGGDSFVKCPVCARIFTSNASNATYCSVRCRQTAQKRAYRQKLKAKG